MSVISANSSSYSAFTVDNVSIDGNTVTTTNANGDLILAANGTGGVRFSNALELASVPISDTNGNEELKFVETASAVNELTVTNAATGNAPKLAASGDDTNIGLDLSSKGTGAVTLWTGNVAREALILPNVASAVNEVTITQAVTATAPSIAATGGDTHIGLQLDAKGTASVVALDPFLCKRTVTTDSTATALTLTAAMILGGIILHDPNGGAATDTTATAAQLVTGAGPGVAVGSSFLLILRNTADAAETITVAAGTGVTLSGTMTIAQNNTRLFLGVFTNVTASSEAVTIYSLGTLTH